MRRYWLAFCWQHSPADLRYATILVPEPSCWSVHSVRGCSAYLYRGTGHPVRASLVSGVLIGVAYLTKEPSLFVAPALMIDCLARRQWRVLFGIAAGVLLVVGLEHTYYLAVTGDLMFRPHAMAEHNNSSYMFNVNQHLAVATVQSVSENHARAGDSLWSPLPVCDCAHNHRFF